MIKKLKKFIKKNAVLIFLFLFADFSIFVAVRLWLQDNYEFINLWTGLKKSVPANIDIYSVYIPIFIGLFAIYWTVLSITMSKKEIALKDYFHYVSHWDFLIVLAINFIEAVVFYFYRRTYLTFCFLFFSILVDFLCLYLAVRRMRTMEDCEEFYDLYEKNVIGNYEKNKNRKDISEYNDSGKFIENFIETCLKKDILKVMICATNAWLMKQKGKMDEKNEFLITKNFSQIFKIYREKIFYKEICKSYLMDIYVPYKIFLDFHKETSDVLKYVYINLLSQCRDIIFFSLHHCEFRVIKNEIQDFINAVQFFSMKQELQDVVNFNQRALVEICRRILNVVQIHKNKSDLLMLIEPTINCVDKIEFSDFDDNFYDEIITPNSFYTPKWTTDYYTALLILFLVKKKIEKGKNGEEVKKYVEQKIKFVNNAANKARYGYERLLDEIEKIRDNKNEISNIFENSVDAEIEMLTKFLRSKIADSKIGDIQELTEYLKKNKTVLNEAIHGEKEELINLLKENVCGENKNGEKMFFQIKSNFVFSAKRLRRDSDVLSYGSSASATYRTFETYIFNRYVSTAKVKNITKLTQMENMEKNGREETLFVSSEISEYLRTLESAEATISKQHWELDTITLDGKTYKIVIFNSNADLFVLRKDVQDFLGEPEIEVGERNDENGENDIFINIDFMLKIKSTGKEHFAYRLIR